MHSVVRSGISRGILIFRFPGSMALPIPNGDQNAAAWLSELDSWKTRGRSNEISLRRRLPKRVIRVVLGVGPPFRSALMNEHLQSRSACLKSAISQNLFPLAPFAGSP